MKKGFPSGERGVEPLAMKIMAGVILLVIGLGIGYAIYTSIRPPSFQVRFLTTSSATIGKPPAGGENTNPGDIEVKVEELLAGYDKTITLSATGVPDNVLVSFSPDSGPVGFRSFMTIKVGPNAKQGTHAITVWAKGPGAPDASGTFKLTITE